MFGVVGVVSVLDGSLDVLSDVLQELTQGEGTDQQRKRRDESGATSSLGTERSWRRRDRSRFGPGKVIIEDQLSEVEASSESKKDEHRQLDSLRSRDSSSSTPRS